MSKQKRLTLDDKKLLSEHVTGETKRCLAILTRLVEYCEDEDTSRVEIHSKVKWEIIKELIIGSPYIEFHPKLLKRIPE